MNRPHQVGHDGRELQAIYESMVAIPELGVEPADGIVVRPDHEDAILVFRAHGAHRLHLVQAHLEHLYLASFNGSQNQLEGLWPPWAGCSEARPHLTLVHGSGGVSS